MQPVEEIIFSITQSLKVLSEPEKTPGMEAYMRNKFSFVGVSSQKRKIILKELQTIPNIKDSSALIPLVNRLWLQPEREYQYIGMDLLLKHANSLNSEHIPFVLQLIESKSWWDTVDMLASGVLGNILFRNTQIMPSLFETLNNSSNFWLNRTAIICQLKFKDKTNIALLESAILPHIQSNEFFIQKSIGWALRQYSKTNPIYVIDFVNKHSLKPLSKKEALKHIFTKS